MRILALASALALGACGSLDYHRQACINLLGPGMTYVYMPDRPPGKEDEPGPPRLNPVIEACAQRNYAQERNDLAVGALALAGAAIAGGAAYGLARSGPSYRSSYRAVSGSRYIGASPRGGWRRR